MKPSLSIVILFCAGFSTLKLTAASADPVRFLDPDRQLGRLAADQKVAVTFVLTNGTDATILIVGTDASCRCTSPQKAPDQILPHHVGEFEWLFSSARSTGPVTQTVSVFLGGGQTIEGQFSANVETAPATVQPGDHQPAPAPTGSPLRSSNASHAQPNPISAAAGKIVVANALPEFVWQG